MTSPENIPNEVSELRRRVAELEGERDLALKSWALAEEASNALRKERDQLIETAVAQTEPTEDPWTTLTRLGFQRRFRFLGHPAWLDGLDVNPPTLDNVERLHREYCAQTFEEYVASIGFTPRFGHRPMTADDFNPRIVEEWVQPVTSRRNYQGDGSFTAPDQCDDPVGVDRG